MKLKKKIKPTPAPARAPSRADTAETRTADLLQGERIRVNHAVEDQFRHGTVEGQYLAANILASTYRLLDAIPLKEVNVATRSKVRR